MADEPQPPPRPAWVKVSLIVVLVVIAAVLAVALVGGGDHGPGRHLPGDGGHNAPLEHAP